MKTRRYVAVLIAVCVVVSSSGFAQSKHVYHPPHYVYPPIYHYHPVYPHPYYPYRTFSYVHPYTTIYFGGSPYYYQGGYFYQPFGTTFQFVFPPIGLTISTLPIGYSSFYMGPNPFFYFNGIFYQPVPVPPANNNHTDNSNNNNSHTEYEVVKPPLGAVVSKLPSGAKVKVIDGQKYYELNGTFYQEQMDENNKLSYVVVGTDGVLNTNPDKQKISEPQIGDRIDNLPSDSKSVVINGERLYSTPSGLYYKKITEGDNTYYELVGK